MQFQQRTIRSEDRSIRRMAISTETVGIVLLVFSLICLGTWPALLLQDPRRLALPPYEAIYDCYGDGCVRRCCFYRIDKLRNVCHVYLDYSTAYFLSSSVPLLTSVFLLSPAEERDDLAQLLLHFPAPLLVTAMLEGALLSMGNYLSCGRQVSTAHL